MLAKITLLLLLQITLFGAKVDIFDFSFHGEFCGNNTPSFSVKTREEEIQLIKNMPAIDIIDEACKKHDLCYVKRGKNNLSCDNELVSDIQKFRKKLTKNNCKILAKAIIVYFDTINYNPITILQSSDSFKEKIENIPTTSMENMFDVASFGSDVMINFTYTRPVDYLTDSKNNDERIKDLFQLFPPKSKKCVVGK